MLDKIILALVLVLFTLIITLFGETSYDKQIDKYTVLPTQDLHKSRKVDFAQNRKVAVYTKSDGKIRDVYIESADIPKEEN